MYRHRLIILFLTIALNARFLYSQADIPEPARPDTVPEKELFRALLFSQLPNMLIWTADRFILHADYAYINLNTIKQNFKTGPVWDNDKMSTNLIAHPYHGNLYFNGARLNGMNFWEACPFVLGGSLVWEFIGENEPPSLNDLMATTFGGIAIGEITYRMSGAIFDNCSHGVEKVFREIVGTLISPMNGIARMVDGSMFHSGCPTMIQHVPHPPFHFSIQSGVWFLTRNRPNLRGNTIPYLTLDFRYGDPFRQSAFKRPYQYFRWNIRLNFSKHQPLIGRLNILGLLWGRNQDIGKEGNWLWGIFQHFNYYESDFIDATRTTRPYQFTETGSIGLGGLGRIEREAHRLSFQAGLHISGILLGASQTEYYRIVDRDYNFGSGYSLKGHTALTYKRLHVALGLEHYNLFTWKGYRPEVNIRLKDPLHLNLQGDQGNAVHNLFFTSVQLNLTDWLLLTTELNMYHRITHYTYFPEVSSRYYEWAFGLKYNF